MKQLERKQMNAVKGGGVHSVPKIIEAIIGRLPGNNNDNKKQVVKKAKK